MASKQCGNEVVLKDEDSDTVSFFCQLEQEHDGVHYAQGQDWGLEWTNKERAAELAKARSELQEE